jgi:hypothetical protein
MTMMTRDVTKCFTQLACVLGFAFAASACVDSGEPTDTKGPSTEEPAQDEPGVEEMPADALSAEAPAPLGDADEDHVETSAATADCHVNPGLGISGSYVQALGVAYCNHRHDIYVQTVLRESGVNKIFGRKTCYNATSCYVATAWYHNPAGTQCWQSAAYMSDRIESHAAGPTACTYR